MHFKAGRNDATGTGDSTHKCEARTELQVVFVFPCQIRGNVNQARTWAILYWINKCELEREDGSFVSSPHIERVLSDYTR